ncbi:hypothetical protein [Chondromyces apiculatus]|uniref:hypothetical protein n=1 Tax=Chondromyces apiculatus TaxID=51 RepID=UPI0005C6F720|nr:hypothetical protein [Chondromyces apiculatus]
MHHAWVCEGVLEITFQGHLDPEIIETSLRQLTALNAQKKLDRILINGLDVENFTPHVSSPAGRLISLARERGAREVVFIVATGSNRMISASVAFAAQIPLKMFETRGEALAYIGV